MYTCGKCGEPCGVAAITWEEPVEFWGWKSVETFTRYVTDCCEVDLEDLSVETEESEEG